MEDATRRRRRRAPRRSVNFRRVAMPEEAFTREKIQLHGSIHRSHVEHMDNPHLCREAIIRHHLVVPPRLALHMTSILKADPEDEKDANLLPQRTATTLQI